MATTRIMPLHTGKGRSSGTAISDIIDYVKNPAKTDNGKLINSYQCDNLTADAQFLLSKSRYATLTGRTQESDVIAYHFRQSFKPGEVTPEEANRIGYEFAERFLKGKHAFIVCTHNDRNHLHNHIIWNSTALDCTRKFRNFWGSSEAIRKLSDTICAEHQLSVIENPKPHGLSYNKWLGNNAKPSHRELLRAVIDDAILQKPVDFEAFLKLIADAGYKIKRGAHISFRHSDQKQSIRLRSLGEGYSEDELRAVIVGEKTLSPHKKNSVAAPKKDSLLINIQAKLDAGKSGGYQKWATTFNLKQMARTFNYLQENFGLNYDELTAKVNTATECFNTLSAQIKTAESRMAEIAVLKTHIINYSKTRDVYAGYRADGYSKKYLAEHESDIILHKAAKKAFDELGVKKLPTVRSLQDEYAKLLAEKKTAYTDYRTARDEMRELLIHKQNIDLMLGKDKQETDRKKEQERQ